MHKSFIIIIYYYQEDEKLYVFNFNLYNYKQTYRENPKLLYAVLPPFLPFYVWKSVERERQLYMFSHKKRRREYEDCEP